MEFGSIYQHGFVRVAACTGRVAIADPPVNAELVLRSARECAEEGVAVALFPELTLTGYSLEDLVLQDAVLDDVERSLATVVEGSADLLPLIVFGAPLRRRNRIYNCAVVAHRGHVLGVIPKSYPPTYREFYEGRQLASGVGERGEIGVAGADAPFGRTCSSPPMTSPGWSSTPKSARTCGSPSRRAPRRRSPARRCSSTCRAARSRSGGPRTASCCAGRRPPAAWPPTRTAPPARASRRPTWRGTARRRSTRTACCSPRPSASRTATAARWPTSTSTCCSRSGGAWGRSTTTGAHTPTAPARSATSRSRSTRRTPTSAPPHRRALPFVPADVDRLNLDCYEAYNIQVAGLQQRLRAIGDPKVVIGVSGGLDSTQALLVAAQAMDRAGRPRSDILGFTLPGFATSEGTKSNAHRLMDALGITAAEIDITSTAELMLKEIDHPYARGEKVYDVTFENVQAGLRTDYLFRIANQRGGIVLGTGDLSELALGWATYGVGDQMSHYNVNGGVPKTFIQHLIRWVVESAQFEDEVSETLALDPRHGDQPRARAGRRAAVDRVPDRPLRAARLLALLHAALRLPALEDRLHGVVRVARRHAGTRPPNFPDDKRVAYDRPEIRRWLEFFCQRFFAFAQFKRSAMPNGPKVSAGGSLSPRGDWRAPSDGSAAAWLRDLERFDWD